jgi:hypothetical protein
MKQNYVESVRLLLDAAPSVFRMGLFCLKGGTAINLFLCDLPRLSVDLDLVYLNYKQDRVAALQEIGAALQIAGFDLERLGIRVVSGSHKEETKLFLERRGGRCRVSHEGTKTRSGCWWGCWFLKKLRRRLCRSL